MTSFSRYSSLSFYIVFSHAVRVFLEESFSVLFTESSVSGFSSTFSVLLNLFELPPKYPLSEKPLCVYMKIYICLQPMNYNLQGLLI